MNPAARGISHFLPKGGDLAIILGATAIICLLILPAPAIALDILIAFNITVGVTLMLIAVYIAAPTDFTAFPSLLLITTLFRLALSIATTRTILTTAHAGRIIDVFGNITAGGNLVVGLVVFLIITIVQLIVIAKGAERVGEVAARFSLDAMPGKQMSIDSDLRAGVIDKDEAHRRRRLLELESKLHGSLDGAMKFVKGDATAGIVIVAINLLGGLTVGMLQQHLNFADAIQTYSVLTIGDGMVTQIPALLSAMAAGLIVTRITGDGDEAHLGEAIRQQMIQRPRVLQMTGLLCLGLACVPGFPSLVFIIFGLFCLILGILLDSGLRLHLAAQAGPLAPLLRRPQDVADKPQTHTLRKLAPVRPIVLRISGQRQEQIDLTQLVSDLDAVLVCIRADLGLVLPDIAVDREAGDRNPLRWRLEAFEVWIGGSELHISAMGQLAALVEKTLRRNLGLFLGVQETTALLQVVSLDYPDVVREAARVINVVRLAEVLRLLIEEETSIRNMHLILEAVADVGQKEKDASAIAAAVRIAISRQVSGRYAADGVLKAVSLGPRLETQLRDAFKAGQLSLTPSAARDIIQSVARETEAYGVRAVLTPPELRRPLRRLIGMDLFDIGVLAYTELRPPLKLEVVGFIEGFVPSLGAAA